ncbi:hypothetical protein [Nocardioides sp.]|uniref:hypothetical protein n=1 Tax=Nocardioides sp. TaxID=35761 RepID=UPI0027204714|nr:hypothetical protein [Nocardioides sp.]MDO9454566.1 hypothetical protein [Nocardioides sp.]
MRASTPLALLLTLVLLAPVAPAVPPAGAVPPGPPTATERAGRSGLHVTPSSYVGGQGLRWTGSLGVPGRRRIVLQQNMNRPGDTWDTIAGFSRRTRANGTFSFTYPAPSMFGVSFRVKGGPRATSRVTFDAKTQDVALWVSGTDPRRPRSPGRARPGQPFGVTVDTSPSPAYPSNASGTPVFPGRLVTLQRRVDGDTWTTLGRAPAAADGFAFFPGLVEPAGTVVYRAREESWTRAGSRIGWFPSFPIRIVVADQPAAPVPPAARGTVTTDTTVTTARAIDTGVAASTTASRRWLWGPALFDFDWERGESLTTAPRGTNPRGTWLDYADGLGKASKHNGGLSLESARGTGSGDVGTTRATLVGNAQKYGRWELRLRSRAFRNEPGAAYRMSAELVPANPADSDCGAHDITIAQFTGRGTTMSFGLAAGDRQWRATRRTGGITNADPAFAVEVTPRAVTWFLNGKPIGSVRSAAASSDVPMTLRLSLVGSGSAEMRHAGLISDWQRAFPLGRGRQAPTAPPLRASTRPTC